MPFSELDHAGIARSLSQIADHRGDLADAFFERSEEVTLPPEDRPPGLRVRRESGVAVRLVRQGQTWMATHDGVSVETFKSALRRAARVMPRTAYPDPRFPAESWPETPAAPEILELPATLRAAVRRHHQSFPFELTVRRHRRWVRVIGSQLASATEGESFYSVEVELEGARYGRLLVTLGETAVEDLATSLARCHAARDAEPPAGGELPVVLGPAAAAVLLHEAVAHALEADTLAQGGHPEAAIGVVLGSAVLDVFDDPAGAPASVRREADDEGHPVVRRCLLRAGVVEQPLADGLWARRCEVLRAGAGRRAHRHVAPGPRSSHLELVPGTASREELLAAADGGLYLPEAERGVLDPQSGELVLRFPYGFRIRHEAPGKTVGRIVLRLHLTDVLGAVRAVGRDAVAAGAGWCAKGGLKMPVWATAPEILLEGVKIRGTGGYP